jgi:hypothetical protein
MTNFDDDDIDDEVEDNEPAEGAEEGAAPASNRNFILALGIMGGIFLLVLIALFVYWLSNRGQVGSQTANISATNAVIMTSNAKTLVAATQAAGLALTPSVTPVPSNTPVPPTATKTQVLAQPSATNTSAAGAAGGGGGGAAGGGVPSVTPNLQTRTATIQAVLTLNAQQTLTQVMKARLTGTATALPKTGFAEDVGLPGMFGLAIGLVLVIVLVRRLRLSPNH